MVDKSQALEMELLCIIVNFGLGSKLIKSAKKYGALGITVMQGKGTVNNKILDFIGLSEIRKEIIVMVADKNTTYQVLDKLNNEYEFSKPNHGIAFTSSICAALGTRSYKCNSIKNERGVDNTMYHVITTIVDKGKAELVIDAATNAGSKGGTIINGRGSGIHETSKLFAMHIEPEKEIVIILSEADTTEAIVSSIREQLKIDEPGNGIIYVQAVNRTCGLYK